MVLCCLAEQKSFNLEYFVSGKRQFIEIRKQIHLVRSFTRVTLRHTEIKKYPKILKSRASYVT